MEEHLIEDAVWQRMLAALATVPYMLLNDLDRLRRFVSACFVVMRTNLTWAELGCLAPSAEAAKRRFRHWAKKGVLDRLMQCSQPVAAPDVLHIDSTGDFAKRNAGTKCHRTATGACGGGEETIGRSRGRLTTKVHHAVDGLGSSAANYLAGPAGRLQAGGGADGGVAAAFGGGRQGLRQRQSARALALVSRPSATASCSTGMARSFTAPGTWSRTRSTA
ncbi:MAG: transposase [Janthinobacterium lividum]